MYSPQEFIARISAEDPDTFFLYNDEGVQGSHRLNELLQNVPIPENDFYQIVRYSSPWAVNMLSDRVVAGDPMITNNELFTMSRSDSFELVVDMFVRLHPEHKNLDTPIRLTVPSDYDKVKYFLQLGFHINFRPSFTKYSIELYLKGIFPVEAIILGIRTLNRQAFFFKESFENATLAFETEWKEEYCKPIFSELLVKICNVHFNPAYVHRPRIADVLDVNSLLKLGITKWLTHVPEGPEVLIALLTPTLIPKDLLMSLVREVELELSVHRRKDLLYFYDKSQKNIRHEVLLANMSISGFHPEELAELVPTNDYEVLRQAIVDRNPVYNEFKKYVRDEDCRVIMDFIHRHL